ncbi:phage protein [Streptococcus mitis 13/39]|uniref:Phage protein n=1 Tax=Streptococcus mitis 13/39 TaxID=1239793 RepID=R0NYE2_STRMT|nr:phage protein [Streptococcus mitis 13/39]
MQLLSREAELELLEKVGDHLDKRLELEKQHNDGWDLISRPDLLDKLGISGTTLNNWEKHGLKLISRLLRTVRRFITARPIYTIFLQ